jgi:hypothetical protein
MAVVEGEFEKGQDNGVHDVLEVIKSTVQAWLSSNYLTPGKEK